MCRADFVAGDEESTTDVLGTSRTPPQSEPHTCVGVGRPGWRRKPIDQSRSGTRFDPGGKGTWGVGSHHQQGDGVAELCRWSGRNCTRRQKHRKWLPLASSSLGTGLCWRTLTCSGNFKMNGSQSLVKQIVDQLNNANLDGTNGVLIRLSLADPCRGRHRSSRHLPPRRLPQH